MNDLDSVASPPSPLDVLLRLRLDPLFALWGVGDDPGGLVGRLLVGGALGGGLCLEILVDVLQEEKECAYDDGEGKVDEQVRRRVALSKAGDVVSDGRDQCR